MKNKIWFWMQNTAAIHKPLAWSCIEGVGVRFSPRHSYNKSQAQNTEIIFKMRKLSVFLYKNKKITKKFKKLKKNK